MAGREVAEERGRPPPIPNGEIAHGRQSRSLSSNRNFRRSEIEASASLIKKVTEEAGARGLSASQLCIYRAASLALT